MKKILKIIIVSVFLLSMISCNDDMHREKVVAQVKKVKEQIIAKVNGIPITVSDYYREEKQLPQQLRELLKNADKKKQFIENLITKELLYQEAKKLNLDNSRKFKRMLNEYKKNLLINEVINSKIRNSVKISDKEAYKYYMKNKSKFHAPDKVEFEKFIFKDYTDATNFLKNHDINQCFSQCFSEIVPLTNINKISSDMAIELKKLKPGEYGSNIMFTPQGYILLKLRKHVKGKLLPFYQVKKEIIENLKQIKEKEILTQYVKTLKETSDIQIFWDTDNKTVKEKQLIE